MRYRRPETVDAIVITHMHADHFLDVIPLRYALKYGPRASARKVPLYLPPGGEAMLRLLCSAFAKETTEDFLTEAFDIRTFAPAETLRFHDTALRFAPTEHFVPTFAVRCDVPGASLAYSSDTAPSQSVAALARDADLFVCEATLPDAEALEMPRGHMSAREAGRLARAAAARRLVLTHYAAEASASRIAELGSIGFGSAVEVADDCGRFEF